MKTLVFDDSVNGHHMEYLHLIYNYVAAHDAYGEAVFVLPEEFSKVKSKLTWKECDRIRFVLMTEDEQKRCECGNLLKASWNKSKIIKKYLKKFSANQVILIMLMQLLPVLLFVLPKGTKIRGILYRICFYEWKTISFKKKAFELFRYWLMSKSSKLDRAFVLNDNSTALYLNRRFKTDKFAFIADPITIQGTKFKNIRKELNVDDKQKLFIHFGGLSGRKGTMEIVRSIGLLDKTELEKYVFVFAGRIGNDIKADFYALTDKLKQDGANIKIYDEFCSYDFLYDLCFSCDAILVPYYNTQQSSGVIGYAAYFGKPVIGPGDGLLGKLIRKNKLGICLDSISEKHLVKAYGEVVKFKSISNYKENNTPEAFINTLMK